MNKALIIWGGWDGHQPEAVAKRLSSLLNEHLYQTTVTSHLGVLLNDDLMDYDVIIPIWSCGISSDIYLDCLLDAIRQGVGLATFHGGINWFDQPAYHEMIGAVYVDDTPPESYQIHISEPRHELMQGMSDFEAFSEQYNLVVNESVEELAFAQIKNQRMSMAWVKEYGKGRVFYSTLAHQPDEIFEKHSIELILKGIEWCTKES